MATAVSEIASDTLNALDSFFGSTSPQPVSVNFESVGPSVPERLAAKLRLQSSARTSGSAQTVGRASGAQTDDTNWSGLPKRDRRRSAAAIPMLTGMSILAGIVGVVPYGSELEQAAIASARSAEVWLLKTSNNAVLPDPEYSTAPRKIARKMAPKRRLWSLPRRVGQQPPTHHQCQLKHSILRAIRHLSGMSKLCRRRLPRKMLRDPVPP